MPYNIRQVEQEMGQILEKLKEEFAKLRTGRASAALIEDIKVPYYGTPTPLKQVASISIPEATMIQVQPWDKNMLGEVEGAIRAAGKGLNATNDGANIRLTLPPLTEERRRDMAKAAHAQAEEARVALRNLRHKEWEAVLADVKASTATEDDKYRVEKELNTAIAKYNQQIEELVVTKVKEIQSI
ncbi:MAG TPA: ribosome recycling factor [Patescibacteria group bacterium]|nr:ribosome recycling factor [Patescibacteria group bacterium]